MIELETGNRVSEWFGHRVFPRVVASAQSLDDQRSQRCPFLTMAKAADTNCIKSEASKGVCTVNTSAGGTRQDWLVCPYRALNPALLNATIGRLFGFLASSPALIVPGVRLADTAIRAEVAARLDAGNRVFIYFDEKLGGELSVPGTPRSPEFSFDVTVFEIERAQGHPHIGRFGIVEIQTMDFHGSYRHAVRNLREGLRMFGGDFPATLQSRPEWLSEGMEGPNIANVFKRTFYQIMFKFQLGQHPRCAGCVLAIPISVWTSWQPHLGAPELREHDDGTYDLLRPDEPRPEHVPAWIYAFGLDAGSAETPSPIGVGTVIATTAAAMSHYALDVAPAEALENIASATGMLFLARRRLRRFWPELAATLTA
jgi:Restriction endonuclease NotI